MSELVDSMKNSNISVCILTYNRYESVDSLLDELCKNVSEETEILVVDNHSVDETPNLLPVKFGTRIRYFRTDRNLGASARNIALSNARGEILVCLDDDIFGLNQEFLSLIQSKFSKDSKLGALNFKVYDEFTGKQCNWVHHCNMDENHNKEFMTYELTEGAVAFRKEAVKLAGYYDPVYFISHEGPDLAFRIYKSGYHCMYSGAIYVSHRHENAGRQSWLNYYYDTKNHIILATKNFPILYATKYLFIGLASMFVYSCRDGFLKYWLRAVKDALVSFTSIYKLRSPLPDEVMNIINSINSRDASVWHKIRIRLFNKSARL